MKNLLRFTAVILIATTYSMAQSNIKVGVSYAKFSKGDQPGISYFTEYSSRINHRFSIAPSLQVAYGSGGSEFPYYLINKLSAGLDINLFMSLLDSDRFKIRLGTGPTFRYFAGRDQSYYYIGSTGGVNGGNNVTTICNLGDGSYCVPLFLPKNPMNLNYLTVGYTVNLEGDVIVSSHYSLGMRISFQGYKSGDNIYNIGVSASRRF